MTGTASDSLRPFYADWAGYNRRTTEGLLRLSEADLALPVLATRDDDTDPWPIWAVAGHTAAMRVFWLCDVFGEPGAEGTPFAGDTPGWEDDLTRPRSATSSPTPIARPGRSSRASCAAGRRQCWAGDAPRRVRSPA